MMRPTRIDARGRSRDGVAVLDYLKENEFILNAPPLTADAVNYFAEEHSDAASTTRHTSRWLGRGAAMLNLDGEVSADAMDALAHGFDPTTGDALSQTAGRAAQWHPKLDGKGEAMFNKRGEPKGSWRGGHRVGFDCTFSIAPKSVSLAFAAADAAERIRILDAMRDAVAQTFDVMEAMIETGRGHGGVDKIPVHGLVASGFTHFSSRELEPQLHEHVLLYAAANGQDGQWGGFEALQLFEHQAMFGALARSAFAKNLQALGYGIIPQPATDERGLPTGEVYFEIAGISDQTCLAFSTRRQQILEHMRLHGGTKQQAALATRKVKEEPPFHEVDQLWQEALSLARDKDPTMFQSVEELKTHASQLSMVSDQDILDRLQAKDAVWTRQQLIAQLAREHVGQKNVAEILTEAERFVARMAPHLIAINPERPTDGQHSGQRTGRKFNEVRYCTRAWFEGVETRMVRSARRRSHEPKQAVSAATIAQAVADFETKRGFSLSGEQVRAIKHVLGGSGIALLTGRAGTGKTTVAEVVVRALEAEGREVIGVALSWNAATKLGQETGLQRVYSAAKLLKEMDTGGLTLTERHVIVLDEAGMADSVTIGRIQQAVDRVGGKLVLQGDSQQLAPVSAGQGFRLLRDAIGDVELTEIRRQKHVEDVTTAELFYTHAGRRRRSTPREAQSALGTQILERMESRGQIERTDTRAEAIDLLVADYLASPLGHGDKLILGSTHLDVRDLNRAVRQQMIESGDIGAQQHAVVLKHGRKRADRQLSVGDRLRFGKLDQDIGVVNGTIGTVESIRQTAKGSAVLSLRLDESGRQVKLDTGYYGELDYAYARTVDRAQGATVSNGYFLASVSRMDVHLGLVAATRYREAFKLYATESDMEMLEEKLGVERLRVNALEEGRAAVEEIYNSEMKNNAVLTPEF
jgi:conjugative relaxase-like TrwC/TraI family protein